MRKAIGAAVNACLRPVGLQMIRLDRLDDLRRRLESSETVVRQQADEITGLSGRHPSAAVEEALGLPPGQVLEITPSPFVFDNSAVREALPTSRELFFEDGQPLPCWRDADLTLYDDWLTNPKNYPIYFAVLRQLTQHNESTRLLEIGVRTGYLGVVFAKATQGRAYYIGVDPNEYVADGLDLASASFRLLRAKGRFDYALIEGYSWHAGVQANLRHNGPYDLIHIDGEHTLAGKLLDLDLARHLVAPGGLVLVDDYDYHAIVAEAIKRALTLHWYAHITHVSSARGLAILSC